MVVVGAGVGVGTGSGEGVCLASKSTAIEDVKRAATARIVNLEIGKYMVACLSY